MTASLNPNLVASEIPSVEVLALRYAKVSLKAVSSTQIAYEITDELTSSPFDESTYRSLLQPDQMDNRGGYVLYFPHAFQLAVVLSQYTQNGQLIQARRPTSLQREVQHTLNLTIMQNLLVGVDPNSIPEDQHYLLHMKESLESYAVRHGLLKPGFLSFGYDAEQQNTYMEFPLEESVRDHVLESLRVKEGKTDAATDSARDTEAVVPFAGSESQYSGSGVNQSGWGASPQAGDPGRSQGESFPFPNSYL